jgi:hypothetical protein
MVSMNTHEINQNTPIGEVPSKVREVTKLFKTYGFTKWRYVRNYELPDPARRIQVRIAYNDRETVKKYADDFRNGDDFPPIVVDDSGKIPNSGGMLIDGVHRTFAREELKEKHIEAIILTDISYEAASEVVKAQLRLLAQKANSQHGKKSTYADAKASAMDYLAVNPTVKPSKLAQMLSVSLTTAKALIAEHNVVNRIEGLKPSYKRLEELKPFGTREGLNQVVIKLLNAHPAWGFPHSIWVELVHLIEDARLNSEDAETIITRVASTFHDDERMDIIARERELFEEKMDGGRLNGKRDVSGPVIFRRAKAMIMGKNADREEIRIDYLMQKNPDLIVGFVEDVKGLRNFLNRLIASADNEGNS